MALKAAAPFPFLDTPNLAQAPALLSIASAAAKPSSFAVIGHRGNGMNTNFPSSSAVRENSILSFNAASRFEIPFVEFDVQVTRDGVPVLFHDILILSRESGAVSEHRVTDLSLEEFLSYGPQRDPHRSSGKPLLRRAPDGRVFDWLVERDDPLCTLEEAFRRADPRLGFNIELKFDDDFVYGEEMLEAALERILRCVAANAGGRRVMFSTFHPDAAGIVRRMQGGYPVYFLTDGGEAMHGDDRRCSLEAAVKLCVESGLEGIVSEVGAVFRDPAAVVGIKERNLRLLTYGQLNNSVEVVYMQRMMGIDGVIVDRVQEISEAAAGFVGRQESGVEVGAMFSEGQLAYLRRLIAEVGAGLVV